jgi:hypothetical protein
MNGALSCAGKVRVRISSPDPFAGLRGHAYIQTRGLTAKVGPMRQYPAGVECPCTPCARERLLPAILAICASHERRRIVDLPQPLWNDLSDDTLLALLDTTHSFDRIRT